jgi:hypothetical protein
MDSWITGLLDCEILIIVRQKYLFVGYDVIELKLMTHPPSPLQKGDSFITRIAGLLDCWIAGLMDCEILIIVYFLIFIKIPSSAFRIVRFLFSIQSRLHRDHST